MKKHFPLIVLILAGLIVGIFALPGFGESKDEPSQNDYAKRTIDAVNSVVNTGTWPASFIKEKPRQGSHGPVFIATVVLLRRLFLPEGTSLENLYFSHFLYFMMFLVGVVSLYFLARRWVSDMAAFGTALLFMTQPLLLGHAFMNPKDVVFMSLLIASAVLGLWMADRSGKSYQATGRPLLDGFRSFFRQFLCVDVWLAGLVLGFSSAIRIAGPLIGLMILVYILLSRKWQGLPRFFAYGLIAFCSMILFWPYLWPDPIGRLIASILINAEYPNEHITLFRGVLVDASAIPFLYLPVLLAVQLTETTLLLVLAGLVSLLRKIRWDLVALIMVWFILPVVTIILTKVNLYNNFRQVFFILPPIFLMAGLGLDWLFKFTRRPVIRFLILFLILLPGLYANVQLYPYQYIYYNQLAGGIRGAYRVFELDYWNLAFREAIAYVNETAGANANIFVGEEKPAADPWVRPDLILNAFGARRRNWDRYDYIIVSTAQNSDEIFAGLPTVFVVEREGVPLVYVKRPHRVPQN
jgi:hypothetical protein